MKSSLFQPILLSSLLIFTLLFGCGTENEPSFKLTTTVSPVGSGTILPTQTTFNKGETAVLEAVPTNGWKFISWEGDLTSSVNPVNLGMTRDYNIIGIFDLATTPIVTSDSISKILATEATIAGNVVEDGGSSVTEKGICYATTQSPTTSGTCIASGSGTGPFFATLSRLVPGTTYYVRAYATNIIGTSYSIQISFRTNGTVSDIDGNVYETVLIGTQHWMAANLRTSRYRTGATIPQVANAFQWGDLTTGAWAIYDNNGANDKIYGKLYNWYAVVDARNLCPTGWHVPSDSEWTVLSNFLGTEAGFKLKSTKGWGPGGNGSNATGFTGLPSGHRRSDGKFGLLGKYADFWSSTQSSLGAYTRYLGYDISGLGRSSYYIDSGFSVRCLRD